jgi:Uma2 family endonuclease
MTTSSGDDLLYELMRSPRLAILREKIDFALGEEQRQREHFIETVREDQKAEFINGEVVVQSPAKYQHTTTVTHLLTLLHAFVSARGLGVAGTEKMLVSLSRNDYEPDMCYFSESKAALFTGDQMRFPAPDLVVEVLSPSTEHTDRTIKFEDYAAHGVGEYWIIDPETESVEQYALAGERYELAMKSRSGQLTSVVVPGFEIPVRAIFDKDENLKTLKALLN